MLPLWAIIALAPLLWLIALGDAYAMDRLPARSPKRFIIAIASISGFLAIVFIQLGVFQQSYGPRIVKKSNLEAVTIAECAVALFLMFFVLIRQRRKRQPTPASELPRRKITREGVRRFIRVLWAYMAIYTVLLAVSLRLRPSHFLILLQGITWAFSIAVAVGLTVTAIRRLRRVLNELSANQQDS
jgi:hypothetical protein